MLAAHSGDPATTECMMWNGKADLTSELERQHVHQDHQNREKAVNHSFVFAQSVEGFILRQLGRA
jgi:hypothetical protein